MKWLYLCSFIVCVGAAAQQTSLPAGSHDPDQPDAAPSTLSSAKPSGIAPALAAAEDYLETAPTAAAAAGS